MRVLMISWEYPPHVNGGLGRHVAELAPALVQHGIQVDVITPVFEPVLSGNISSQVNRESTTLEASPQTIITKEKGVSVHRIHVPQLSTTDSIYYQATEVNTLIQHYLSQLEHRRWDLIHIHDWLAAFAGLALRQSYHIPLITTIHATERGRTRGFLNNDLQRSIDHKEAELVHGSNQVIVCSHYMSGELQSFFETPQSKVEVIPNGVDIGDLNPHKDEDLTEFRARFADKDERIVFTVSRLVYEKGVHRLVEATPAILENCPLARIIIAGRGPELENLKSQAQHLGVADKVDFVGFISNEDRNRLLKVANCAVFPSLYEPFGIVALEAMALECPVIVSDVGGFSEVVAHQDTGVTIFPDDAESVAWGVSYVLNHPIWARRRTIKARNVVRDQFNWNRIARLTKAVYEQTLKSEQIL